MHDIDRGRKLYLTLHIVFHLIDNGDKVVKQVINQVRKGDKPDRGRETFLSASNEH